MKQLTTLVVFLFFAVAVSAQKVVTVAGTYSDVVYVPSRDALYAVRPASDPEGNTLCRIDPLTGEVGACVVVGADPSRVVATTSGDYLYLGFTGEPSIKRFNLTTGAIDLEFTAGGIEDPEGPFYPEDLLPLRGSDDLLAVTRRNVCCYPRSEGVVIFEEGRQLAQRSQDFYDSNVLTYGETDDVIFGYATESGSDLRRMTVGEFGITDVQVSYGFNLYEGRLEYADNRLYTTNGQVGLLVDGNLSEVRAASIDGFYNTLAVEPVPSAERIYYLMGDYYGVLRLLAVNATTLLQEEEYTLMRSADYSSGKELVQLGSEETFAFLTSQNVLGLATVCRSSITETPPPYAGSIYLCTGAPLALIAPAGAREAGQGILWSDGQTGDTVYITTPGVYSYRVTDAGGCPGPSSPDFELYQTDYGDYPAVIYDPLTNVICTGGAITLTAEYGYGSRIVWNTGDTTSTLTVTEAGIYTARGISDYTDCLSAASNPQIITAVDAPVPAAPVVDQGLLIDTCTTRPIGLSVSQPALEYFWNFENAYSSSPTEGSNMITVYPVYEPARYTVSTLDFNGCLSETSYGLINFYEPPQPTYIQYNTSTGTLASYLSGPLVWYYQDEVEGESTGRFYTPLRNGFYSARVKGEHCLSDESNLVSVTGITTATVDDEASRRVEVFPNPTRDELFVNFDRSLWNELPRGGVKYQLFGADGRLVSNGVIDPTAANAPIPVAGMPAGVYLLTFTSSGQAVLRKRITIL